MGRVVGNQDLLGFVSDGSSVVYPVRPQDEGDLGNGNFSSRFSGVHDAGQIAVSINRAIGSECNGGPICDTVISREVAVLDKGNLQYLNMPEVERVLGSWRLPYRHQQPGCRDRRRSGVQEWSHLCALGGLLQQLRVHPTGRPASLPLCSDRYQRQRTPHWAKRRRSLAIARSRRQQRGPAVAARRSVCRFGGAEGLHVCRNGAFGVGTTTDLLRPARGHAATSTQSSPGRPLPACCCPTSATASIGSSCGTAASGSMPAFELTAGETFDLLSQVSPNGLRKLRITGIETSAALDPRRSQCLRDRIYVHLRPVSLKLTQTVVDVSA